MGNEMKEIKDMLFTITNKLDVMNEKLDRFLNNTASTENKSNEFKSELDEIKNEEIYNLNEFRKETNERFNHIEEQLRLLNIDIEFLSDETVKYKREINRLKHA